MNCDNESNAAVTRFDRYRNGIDIQVRGKHSEDCD